MGKQPGRPPAACRNNIGVIGAPTDIGWNCGLTNWSFFCLQFSPILAHDDRRNRGAFKRIRWPAARLRGVMGSQQVDAFLIGAPLGLGILLALVIIMVAISHLSQ